MKIKMDLRKVLVATSAIIALVTGSVFFIMYSNSKVAEDNMPIEASTINSFVITPDNMGKYGELMFAYIGENNYLYNLDDESKPLIEQPASILLYASDDTVLYVTPAETDPDHFGRESVIQELQIGEYENSLYTIATVSVDPCWSSNDEVIYFVKDDNLKQLCTFEPLTSTTEVAAEFESNIIGLRISSDGLLVTVETGEEKLYVPLSKTLTEAYYNCQGSRVIVCEQYDLILTPSGELFYRWLGSNEPTKIADNVVVTKGYQDNEIFFIQNTEEGKILNDYFVSEGVTKELTKLPDNVMPQLTISANYAFVIDYNNVVYKYDIELYDFYPFTIIDDGVKNPMISVYDYRLMVYDLSRESDQTFVSASDANVVPDDSTVSKINAYIEKKNASVTESVYPTLSMPSIGSDVQALQDTLLILGYLKTSPTGIFDVNTTVAVQRLQSDLGMEQSGVVDEELQELMADKKVSVKESYSPISLSSKGVLVRDLQARLNTLGYRVSPVNGTMDEETITAMQSFAGQNHIKYNGDIIDSTILNALYSKDAVSNQEYVALKQGDCHHLVQEFNQRLKSLGYLAGSVNPSFDLKTVSALGSLKTVNNSDFTGKELIDYVFSENVSECPNEMRQKALNDSNPSNPGQVISDRQLKIIRKWLTKQFAVNHTDKQAIKRLQMQLVRMGRFNVENVSMIYDKNTFDAVATIQQENDLPVDGIASKSTMTIIFASDLNRSENIEDINAFDE